jgi:hypothetical protein
MTQHNEDDEYEEVGTGFLDEVDEDDYEDEEDLVEEGEDEDEDLQSDVVDEEPGPSAHDLDEAENWED